MNLSLYILLILSVVIGAGLAYGLRKFTSANLNYGLAFGGAYLLGITVLHLLPEIYAVGDSKIGIWILVGFLLQLFLEYLSGGLEHGHVHDHAHNESNYLLQILLGLCVHSIIEGLPLERYESFHEHVHEGHDHGTMYFVYAIMLHKIPAAFALTIFILKAQYSKLKSIFVIALFALSSPLGAFIGNMVEISMAHMSTLLAIVVGSFLHIATVILFENEDQHHHKFQWQKLVFILIGLGLSLLSVH